TSNRKLRIHDRETSLNAIRVAKKRGCKRISQMPIDGATSEDDSVGRGLAELAELARQAFEQKRRQQALALTSAILKIDPHYTTALVIRQWIQQDHRKELSKANAQVEVAWREESLASSDRPDWPEVIPAPLMVAE